MIFALKIAMTLSTLKKEIEKLENQFLDAEDDFQVVQSILENLKELHKSIRKKEGDEGEKLLSFFQNEVSDRFGGMYVPYLLWDEIAQFVFNKDESRRESIQKLINAFANGYFDEQTQKWMKPLLIIYFYYELPLKIREFRERFLKRYHPKVQEYFEKLIHYKEKNPRTTVILFHKFERIHPLFPDFELFDVPLDIIEEQYPRPAA